MLIAIFRGASSAFVGAEHLTHMYMFSFKCKFNEVALHFFLWALASVLSNPLCNFEISSKSLLSLNYSDFISHKHKVFYLNKHGSANDSSLSGHNKPPHGDLKQQNFLPQIPQGKPPDSISLFPNQPGSSTMPAGVFY